MSRLRGGGRPVQPLTATVAALGVALTVILSVLALAVHHRTDQHLLDLQVHQAADTLAAVLPVVQSELSDGLQVAQAAHSSAAFAQFSQGHTGPGHEFSSLSLWQRTASGVTRLALVGGPPALVADGQAGFLSTTKPGGEVAVTDVLPDGNHGVLGYAVSAAPGNLVAYAETALPPGGRVQASGGSAFSDLHFALYLNSVRPSDFLESDVPIPVRGSNARASAPFGNASIILVGTPTTDLAGGLSAALPWVVLGTGLAVTVGGAFVAELLGRRRQLAEDLAQANQHLYLEQRNIATTFQRALLPEVPELDQLEVDARYLPGTAAIEIGGDWYDVVAGRDRCTFVVGDVSGRGLRAAATMASLRFSTRAYIDQMDHAEEILAKLARLHEFKGDEQFATVLIGELDITTRRLRLVSAGHPPPLIVEPGRSEFVEVPVSAPIGVGGPLAGSVAVDLPAGAVLIAYTDGLIERRGEPITAGLERLRTAAVDPTRPVQETVDRLVADLLPDGPVDDSAILALRWPPRAEAEGR